MSRQRSFTSIQTFHTHTHTPCLWQGGVCANEVKVRMNGGNEDEMNVKMRYNEMKDYLSGPRGGERKRRGEEQTPTPTYLARSGQTPKGQGKKKSGGRRTRNKTSGGGKTEAPEPTSHSETYAYLGTHRTRPTWGGKNA